MGERRTHPALDFIGDKAQVGIMDANFEKWIVDSTRHSIRAKDRQDLVIELPNYIGVAGRWPAADIEHYLAGEKGPSIGTVVQGVMGLLDHYLELRRPHEAALIACWTVGTYLYPLFPAYPRLNLQGERGTGKSKMLEVIAGVAFNGLCMLDPTPAVLFRLISPLRPTLCLDEMERLGRQDKTAIFGILNAGYKSGAVVNRTEGDAGNRYVAAYHVYAPTAFGSISGLNTTTADRSITLTTIKGRDIQRVNRPVDIDDPRFAELRAGCYRLALTQFKAVRTAWEGLSLPPWLKARHRELYAPLLTIATLADADTQVGLTGQVLDLAHQELDERGGMSDDGEALFQLLAKWMGEQSSITVRPKELAVALELSLEERINSKDAGLLLRRYGFYGKRGSQGFSYRITSEDFALAMSTYGYQSQPSE